MRKLLATLMTLLIGICVLAFGDTQEKSFNLLASPNTDAKTVAKLAIGTPIMPIIRQNGWVKVADPKTGNVGWVQSNKIEKSPVVITQIIAGSSNYCKDNNCQFSFYSSSKPLTPQENDALWQRVHAQERYILSQQAAMQKQITEFMDDLNTLMMRSTTAIDNVETTPDQNAASTALPSSNTQAQPEKTGKKPFWKFWGK